MNIFGTLSLLAMNQKHQDVVVDELRSIFETAVCMNYTERVIKESLRLSTPIPFLARNTSDIHLAKGTVPKNTLVKSFT